MSIVLSKLIGTAVIVGLGGAVSALGGHKTEEAPTSPVVQHAAGGNGMCAIASSFSANPVMADQIRVSAGCPKGSASR